MRVVALVALALLAGCLQAAPEFETPAAIAAPALSTSLPEMVRDQFQTTAALPLPGPLAIPAVTLREFEIPAGNSFFQLAIDLVPSLTGTAPAEEASVRVLSEEGEPVFEMAPTTAPAKAIAWLDDPAGAYSIEVTSKGVWDVGIVTVSFPADFTPGIFVNVSFPEQREIDHSFKPKSVTVSAGERVRFTTFDHDPHEGIENLQHNVFIPKVNAKTEGQTTWGEVRTLDFTAPTEPGSYDLFCEFHERTLRGTLVVK